MKEKFELYVPSSISEPEEEALIHAIKAAIKKSDAERIHLASLKVFRARGPAEDLLLLFVASSSGWFTVNWCNDYLWPEIKKVIDQPSNELIQYFRNKAEQMSKNKLDKSKE